MRAMFRACLFVILCLTVYSRPAVAQVSVSENATDSNSGQTTIIVGDEITISVTVTVSPSKAGGTAVTAISGSCTSTYANVPALPLSLSGASGTLPTRIVTASVNIPASTAASGTVSCTATATITVDGEGEEFQGNGSANFSVVDCTGTFGPIPDPSNSQLNDQFTESDWALNVNLNVVETGASNTSITATGEGLTGDSGLTDCDGADLSSEPESPSIKNDSVTSDGSSATFTWTVTSWAYEGDDPCNNCDSDAFDSVEAVPEASVTTLTASCR
jgi:hypothetical protein